MRLKTIAKLIILLFVFLVILSGIRTCSRSISTSTTTYVPPPQVPQVPQQQTAPQQQTTVQPLSIQPLVVDEKIRELVKGAVLDIYNVPCSPGDTLPPSPVYTGLWKETDIEKLSFIRIAPNTVFSRCTLMRLRFFYYAGVNGIYTFAIRSSGAEAYRSMRINSVQVISLTRNREATGQVTLSTGWYEVDIRFYFNRDEYPYWYGYRLLQKRPNDNQMVVMSKDDIYVTRTDAERLQR